MSLEICVSQSFLCFKYCCGNILGTRKNIVNYRCPCQAILKEDMTIGIFPLMLVVNFWEHANEKQKETLQKVNYIIIVKSQGKYTHI